MTLRAAAARVAAVAATLPLAGAAMVAAAPPAGADVTSPGDGTVFTSYSTIQIRADYGRSSSENTLTLTSPGGPAVQVASAPAGLSGGTMTYSLDTGCWTYPSSSCSGSRLAPNGTWTVTQGGGGGSGSSTFVTRIRPAAPTGVTASALSEREVRISWRRGEEPDLTGYAVLEGSQVRKDGIGLGACDKTTCSTVVSYDEPAPGEHTYTVRAFRSSAPGSNVTLDSEPSAPATARLTSTSSGPTAEPAPSGEAGEGSGSGSSSGETGTVEGSSGEGSSSGDSGEGAGASGSGTEGGAEGGAGTGSATGSEGGGTGKPGPGAGPAGPGTASAPLGAGTTSAGATADQRALAQRQAFALGFSAFGPKLGIPKLPPLPQAQAPAVAAEPDGTYEPTLGFPERVVTERVPIAQQAPVERVREVVGSALDSERLVRSTAGALLLLLAAAHLRRWLSSAAKDQ